MLAYPSFKDMSEAISSGTLIDCPVTIQSLRRSTDIYGTPDGILKGKTTHTTTAPDKIITVMRPAGNDVHLNGDIFFIEGLAFFLTLGTPVNLLGVTALANRTVTTISKALDQHRATAHSWHRLSPREMLTGIKTCFTRDLRIGFLDYAQLTEPVNETTYNSLNPRIRGGVALYSLGNSKGSIIFMTLDTGTEVAREKFHLLPMPDVVHKTDS